MNKISVVIPVKEEMALQYHRKIIHSYSAFPNCELTWVIGPNNDGTYQDLINLNQHVIQTTANSRADRINLGIEAAHHALVLINHPRSFLSPEAIAHLSHLDIKKGSIWGGFTHRFHQSNHYALKFTSRYSNSVRFDLFGIVYLDHCMFLTRDLIDPSDAAPVPQVDIFEDTLFSQKLLKTVKPLRIHEYSNTSPIRFLSNGIFKQSLMNQQLKIKHMLGFSKQKMNEAYERDLNLNSKYEN